ncbi:histidine kinase [Paenibacillus glacialis]|uniref:histidine kinase n=2 Tax=Paenibacillus glacialis TaxID=494026 RepID=A0A162LXW3_9BACL|nr:histidine kinase [Paenibacillus glacialis]
MGIRLKLILIFTSSVIFAGLSIIILQKILSQSVVFVDVDISRWEERYSFVYFAIFVILTFIFFYVLTIKIIRRIKHIDTCVNLMKEGNLDIRIQMETQDEIGNLARGINAMVQSLKESMEREHQAENMKNEMIASISHDLRTPVTSLIGYMDLIKTDINSDILSCTKYVDICQKKCDDLKNQIQDLLDYCHINFQGIPMNKVRVDIKELLQQVIIDFVPQLEKADMAFTIENSGESCQVEVDIALLVRLLQNMISNGIFYGYSGKMMNLRLFEEGDNVIIQIANYGKPILPEDIPYIFEKYYRAEKSRSRNTGGKGMGLAIAKSIAEIHGGSIAVKSTEAETVFSIMLPSARS